MQNRNGMPAIVAKLDLSDENHRLTHDVMRRTHTGRWPMWKSLAMRQIGGVIYEVARECPRRKQQRCGFVLLRWTLDVCGISWTPAPSKRSAMELLRTAG